MICRYYGLVPIAAEDYSGYDAQTYYAVAVARRTESYLTIFNLKGNNAHSKLIYWLFVLHAINVCYIDRPRYILAY